MRRFVLPPLLILVLAGPASATDAPSRGILARIDALRAADRFEEALDLVEAGLVAPERDPALALELEVRRGSCLLSLGRPAQAKPVLASAVEAAAAQPDSTLLCDAVRWFALSRLQTGERAEAYRMWTELFALAEACGSREYMGWARVGKGWQDFQAGRPAEAASSYRDAVRLFDGLERMREPRPERGPVWAWNGVGLTEQALGNHAAAIEAYETAARLARAGGSGRDESMVVNNLGSLIFGLGDPGRALGHFLRARDLQVAAGGHYRAVRPALNVVLCRMGLGRYGRAEADLDSLAGVCRERGFRDLEGVVLCKRADLVLNRKREHRAVELYREALSRADDLPFRNRIDARVGLARCFDKLGRHEAALAELGIVERELAGRGTLEQHLLVQAESGAQLKKLDRHREALARLDDVIDLAGRYGRVAYLVRAWAEAAASHRALARPDSALAALRLAAGAWEEQRVQTTDPQWREQRALVGRIIFPVLAATLLDRGEDAASAFDQLQRYKARTLLERLRRPGEPDGADPDPVDLDEIRTEVLSPGELLLDAYVGRDVSLLFAVTADTCRVVRLPGRAELEPRLRHFARCLSRAPAGDDGLDADVIAETGGALRRLLLGEVEDLVADAAHLLYSPDGPLHDLPPAVLAPPGSAGAWSRIPSATILAHLRAEARGDAGGILALAGGPGGDEPPLPGARAEVRRLAERYRDVETRIGAAADGAPRTAADLDARAVLHLATHARVDAEAPWSSTVRLPGFGEAGALTAAEIAAARLDARLAVLAACGSGTGRVVSGEGVLGLGQAFLAAGVPAVVATLWPVDDAVTARAMGRFYDGLARGLTSAEALAGARAAVRADPSTAHPVYWAGFVLVGDGGVRVPLERRPPVRRLVLGGLGLLALGLFVASWRRPS